MRLLRLVHLEALRTCRRRETMLVVACAGLVGAWPAVRAAWDPALEDEGIAVTRVVAVAQARETALLILALLVTALALGLAMGLRGDIEEGRWRAARQVVPARSLLLGKALGIALATLLALGVGLLGISVVSGFLRRPLVSDVAEVVVLVATILGAISCGLALSLTRVRRGGWSLAARLALPIWLILPVVAAWLVMDGAPVDRVAKLQDGFFVLLRFEGLMAAVATVGPPGRVLLAVLVAMAAGMLITWLAMTGRAAESA